MNSFLRVDIILQGNTKNSKKGEKSMGKNNEIIIINNERRTYNSGKQGNYGFDKQTKRGRTCGNNRWRIQEKFLAS